MLKGFSHETWGGYNYKENEGDEQSPGLDDARLFRMSDTWYVAFGSG